MKPRALCMLGACRGPGIDSPPGLPAGLPVIKILPLAIAEQGARGVDLVSHLVSQSKLLRAMGALALGTRTKC